MRVADLLFDTLRDFTRLDPESQRVFTGYYPRLRDDPEHWAASVEPAYQFIYQFLRSRPNATILDVGCGVGTESLAFAAQGAAVLGIDVTEENLACARARLLLMPALAERVAFERRNLLDLDSQLEFDALWLNQSFHHLEPRAQVVAKLASLLKPGARLFISETNAASPIVQLLLFRARGWQTIREYEDESGVRRMYGRERVTTARALEATLVPLGLTCAGVHHYKVFPNSRSFATAERFAGRLRLPRACYANYIVEFVKS